MTITVVLGPPCSGKSTFVVEHAAEGDVVVDFDKLAAALGSNASHDAPVAIRRVTHAARAAAIKLILSGVDADAWIIHSSPTSDWMSRYEAAGAQIETIDPGLDVCLERAQADGRPEWTEDAIRSWYASEKRAGGLMLTKNAAAVGLKAGPDDGLKEGQFAAYASVFGNIDSYGDVVIKGAFAKDLERWEKSGNPIPLLFGHNMSDPDYNLGHLLDAKEDDTGLLVTAQLDLDNPKAKQVYRMLKGRRINQMSFAYDVIEGGPASKPKDGTEDEDDPETETFYELRQLKLYEVSVVTLGANQETEILAVKQMPVVAERLIAEQKAGRVLSAKNESELRQAHESIGRALSALDSTSDEEKASDSGPSRQAPAGDTPGGQPREASRKSSVDPSALLDELDASVDLEFV